MKQIEKAKNWYNSLSKKQKIFVWVMGLFIIGTIAESSPNVDPCKCYESFNKERMIGFSNLSTTSKEFYNDYVRAWDNSRKANNGCLDKMGIQQLQEFQYKLITTP